MKIKRFHPYVLLLILLISSSSNFSVKADVPSILRLSIEDEGGEIFLIMEIRHRSPSSNHYVDEIQIKIGDKTDTVTLESQPTVEFTNRFTIDSKSDEIQVRAHCTIHGWSNWESAVLPSPTPTPAPTPVPSPTPTEENGRCIIATTTYGSELSPEVQFLRSFRNKYVLNTFAGKNFMTVFNAWYYSFSPGVASSISANNVLRGIMKILLYPLIGILHITATTYSLFDLFSEFAILISGLVASSLIGVIYIAPLALIIHLFNKVNVHPKTLRAGLMIWGLSIGGIAVAEITRWSTVMMFFAAVFVLITMVLATLSSVKYVTRYIKHARTNAK